MIHKSLIFSLIILLFSTVNSIAATEPNTVDPEKEQSKKKSTIILKKDVDSLTKELNVKGETIYFEEPATTTGRSEVKEEKKKDNKEDVQSFNFLYYMLQSKISDFITY